MHAYFTGIDWFSFYCLLVGLAGGYSLARLLQQRRYEHWLEQQLEDGEWW